MQSTQSQDQELNVSLVRTSSRWLRLARLLALLFILFCLAAFFLHKTMHPESVSFWLKDQGKRSSGPVKT